jgi:hypothetical protein
MRPEVMASKVMHPEPRCRRLAMPCEAASYRLDGAGTPSRRSEAGGPEFSRRTDTISPHLLVTSNVQAFSETRSTYYALC